MARPALFTNSSEGGKHLGDEAIDRLFASHVHLDRSGFRQNHRRRQTRAPSVKFDPLV